MAKSNKKRKRSAPKKPSNQKENRPKKDKVIKPDRNESITMSKKLMQKKCACKKTRRNTNSTNKNNMNGKPMPTLADLEKMFEDSDDNLEDANTITHKESLTGSVQDLVNTETITIPDIILTDVLFSPTTRKRIGEQVKEILNKSASYGNDAKEITPLPQNNIQEEFDDLPKINFDSTITDNRCNEVYDMDKNVFRANNTETSINPFKQNDIDVPNTGHESDNSLDSNKTVQYSFETSTPKPLSNSNSPIFSPLPSTSRDDTTFSKNDELFLESLKEINNNQINEISPKQDIVPIKAISPKQENVPKQEIPQKQVFEDKDITIVIDDEIMEEHPIKLEPKTNKDIQNIEFTNENLPTNTRDTLVSNTYDDDDDDCMIVETAVETKEMKDESKNKDDVKNFIQPETNFITDTTESLDHEIIDIDALIAQNTLILNKYTSPHSSILNRTLVVDVDVSTLKENVNNRKTLDNTTQVVDANVSKVKANANNIATQNQSSANEHDENLNMSTSRQNQSCNLGAPTNVPTEYSRNSNPHSQSNDECEIVSISENLNYVTPYPASWIPSGNRVAEQLPINNIFNMMRNGSRSNSNTRRRRRPQLQNSYEMPLDVSWIPSDNRVVEQLPINNIFNTMRNGSRSNSNTRRHRPSHLQNSYETCPSSNQGTTATQSPVEENHGTHPKPAETLGDCPICLDKLSRDMIGSTICGHLFCMNCLEKSVKTNKRCPTCRQALKKGGYHKIFL